jgi:hypothetical protein
MNAHHFVVVSALGVFFGLGSAHADTPQVYDSTAGPGGAKLISPGLGQETLDVYIDLGTDGTTGDNPATESPRVPCVDGNGDELCAADVLLTLEGPGTIDEFHPDVESTVIYEIYETSGSPSAWVLRLNVLQSMIDPQIPPVPPLRLGSLDITSLANASETNQVKVVATGQVVKADGTLDTIPSWEIAKTVPEPSGIVLLLSGALGLAALHWLRTRGAGVTVTGEFKHPR